MFRKGTTATPSLARTSHARHHTPLLIRNVLVLVSLGLFVTAAALAVVKPQADTELPAAFEARQTLMLPDPLPTAPHDYSAPFISETQIQSGDTLAVLLQRLHVDEPELQRFLVHNKDARSIYKLYPGRTMQAALDANGRLVWLRYNHAPGKNKQGEYVSKWLEVKPDDKGGFVAKELSKLASSQVRIAQGRIESSLFGATDAANIPDAITLQMTEILGSKIDFIKDLRKGDRFRIVYQSYSDAGKTIGAGRILALEFINQDNAYEAVWFQPEAKNSSGAYFDFDGRSLKGAFLRTALKFTRISSTFGRRLHPLHGKWTRHDGVDYAARRGTPIHATADGTVKFIGKQRGYGNVIILQHRNHTRTLYAHQKKFAKGLKKGQKVTQSQVIGYVGSTGWATGPHLHYEFRINNKPVNPLAADLPVERTLAKSELAVFERTVASYKTQIDMLAQLQDENIQLASR